MGKRLITAEDIIKAAEKGNTTVMAPPEESIVTPMARDQAETLGVVIDQGSASDAGDSRKVENVPDELIVSQICELIQNRLPSVADAKELEQLVREKVASRFDTSLSDLAPSAEGDACVEGVCFISGQRLMAGGAQPTPVEEKILVADAIQCGDGNKLSGGCMEWEKASFSRTVEFPEIDIVIEGELKLTVGQKSMTGQPGDMVYLPKGVTVTYGTPSRVRLACVNCIS